MDISELVSYINSNTDIEITDIFKYLYQSSFGCEHFVLDFNTALKRIYDELKTAESDDLPEIEPLGKNYCRVHLKSLKNFISPEEFCSLFVNSAENRTDGLFELEKGLNNLIFAARSKLIPFNEEEISAKIEQWRKGGFESVHHSDKFKNSHHPAYRVLKTEFINLLNK